MPVQYAIGSGSSFFRAADQDLVAHGRAAVVYGRYQDHPHSTAVVGADTRERMKRRAFLAGSLATLGVAAAAPALAQQSAGPPPGFVRLRVAPGELTVDGKMGKAYRIEQEDGRLGWTGRRGARFQVALDNGLAEPVAIHWHGLILPNGQDGVPYVTQPPIKPGERRLYDFALVQAGTYWMHSHHGLQEQRLMTAPLIVQDVAEIG